jgi:hypothetical protein
MTTALAKLDKARLMLFEARTLPEVKKIRDIAEAARVYAKAANVGREAQNYAGEIALLAACKAGEILEQLGKSNGGRPKKTATKAVPVSEYKQTLKDTSTSSTTAKRWQKMAAIPEKKRAEYIAAVKESPAGEVTASGLLKLAKPVKEHRAIPEPRLREKVFDHITEQYKNIDPEIRAREIRLIFKNLCAYFLIPEVES